MDCWKLSTSGWLDGCVEGLRAPRLKLEGVKEGGKGGGNRSEDKLTGGADIAAAATCCPNHPTSLPSGRDLARTTNKPPNYLLSKHLLRNLYQ